MALAVALIKYAPEGVPEKALVKVTMSNTPAGYVAGGDTLNLTSSTWSDPNGKGLIGYPTFPPSMDPSISNSAGFTSTAVGTYATIVPGTNLTNYKIQILTPGGSELAAGNYPADMLTGYFELEVFF